MAWTETVAVADDLFHPRTDDPWWNEASYITFRVPERDLIGLLYFYFRPNQNTVMGGPIIWDPTGLTLATTAHNGWAWHMPIPDGAEMFNFGLVNGFNCETIDTQKEHRYTYASPGCEFDLRFTASYPPHYMKFDRKNNDVDAGMYDWVRDVEGEITTGHYEHFGRMNGSVILNGETIAVENAVTFRDHTWGPRQIIPNMDRMRVAYSLGMGDDENAFNTFATCPLPWQEDPVDGVTDRITSGFYVKDGVGASIVAGTRRRKNADDGRPLGEVIEARDELGRTLQAESRTVAALEWPNFMGDFASFWSYQVWDFDRFTDAGGELQEAFMARHFRKWMLERRRAV
jgi:hypothetical protein